MLQNTGTEQHRHHAVEVAVYNVLSFLWEMETGLKYAMTKDHDIYSGLGAEAALAPLPGDIMNDGKDLLDAITEGNEDDEEEEKDKYTEKGEDETKDKLETDDSVETDSAIVTPPPPPTPMEEATAIEAVTASTPPPPPSSSSSSSLATEEINSISSSSSTTVKTTEQELIKLMQRAENIAECLRDVKIIPLLGPPSTVLDKPKFLQTFDCAFVSARFAQCIELPYFAACLKDHQAVVAVETAKFLVPLAPKVQVEFSKKEEEYAHQHGWNKIQPPPVFRRHRDENDKEDDVMFYTNF